METDKRRTACGFCYGTGVAITAVAIPFMWFSGMPQGYWLFLVLLALLWLIQATFIVLAKNRRVTVFLSLAILMLTLSLISLAMASVFVLRVPPIGLGSASLLAGAGGLNLVSIFIRKWPRQIIDGSVIPKLKQLSFMLESAHGLCSSASVAREFGEAVQENYHSLSRQITQIQQDVDAVLHQASEKTGLDADLCDELGEKTKQTEERISIPFSRLKEMLMSDIATIRQNLPVGETVPETERLNLKNFFDREKLAVVYSCDESSGNCRVDSPVKSNRGG